MKNKTRILELLKEAPEGIKSMTVGQLVEKLSKDLQKEKEDDETACNNVCSEFKGTYIKFRDEKSLFGPGVNYIHIKDIKAGSLTTDWERMFDIAGQKIYLSNTFFSSKKMKMNDIHNSMTAKELQSAEKITKEDFEGTCKQLEYVQTIIDNMNK